MGMWRNLDRDFFSEQGITYDPKMSKAIAGMTLCQAAEYFRTAYNIKKTTEMIVCDWEKFLWHQYDCVLELKPFVKEYVQFLYDKGVKMCVATLTDKQMAEAVLKRHGLLNKMEFVMTVEQVKKSKLHPDIYLRCARDMEVDVLDCVVFEDTLHAIKTAKNAGFKVVGVYDEYNGHTEEIKKECDKFITNFVEIKGESL